MPAQRQARDAAQLISQLTLYTGNGAHYHHKLQSPPIISRYDSKKNAVFCDFLSLCPHILPYTYREPQAEKHRSQKSEEAALPHSILFHGTKPTPYTSSPEDLRSVLRDARQIGSALSVFAKHFDAITMARSF